MVVREKSIEKRAGKVRRDHVVMHEDLVQRYHQYPKSGLKRYRHHQSQLAKRDSIMKDAHIPLVSWHGPIDSEDRLSWSLDRRLHRAYSIHRRTSNQGVPSPNPDQEEDPVHQDRKTILRIASNDCDQIVQNGESNPWEFSGETLIEVCVVDVIGDQVT